MLTVAVSQFTSLTNLKILLARLLYKSLRLFVRDNNKIINRNGINYSVDLSEGVDFSLFLLGKFQNYVVQNLGFKLRQDAVIIDVGANIGHMTLEFAKNYPQSKLYAFEPTNYAFEKLKTNISLNPDLKDRIFVHKAIVSKEKSAPVELKLYSSWKLDDSGSDRHKVHGGISQSTSMVEVTTIDALVEETSLKRVDLIKIDTDGSELSVLLGSLGTLRNLRPNVIFEIGLYLLEEKNISFQQYFDLFKQSGYTIRHAKKLNVIDMNNYKSFIPKLGTTDLIAIPDKR